MRESGFDVPMDEATQAKFEELHYLETSTGKTGLRALKPMLSATRSTRVLTEQTSDKNSGSLAATAL